VASANEKAMMTTARLTLAFKMFDKDGSGMITPSEIRQVLSASESKIPNTIIDAVIKQVDQNGDGQISLEEFTILMRNATM
jgi:Ca2+-binding EF-hand superfamily protein